jgi:hypothetical protein
MRRERPTSRPRSRNVGRAIPGRRPRRCRGAGERRCGRAIGHRKRSQRFCSNVAAAGVRREPLGHAARPRRARHRSRRAYTYDSAGATAGAATSRSRVPLSRLLGTTWPRPPHQTLGERRPNHVVESRSAVSAPPSSGTRRGLPGRTTARRRAAIPPPGWRGHRCPAGLVGRSTWPTPSTCCIRSPRHLGSRSRSPRYGSRRDNLITSSVTAALSKRFVPLSLGNPREDL